MTTWMIVPVLAFQLVFEPTPVPSRPPAPDSPYFEREVERRKEQLTKQCYSPEAIAILIEDLTERRKKHLATDFNRYAEEVRQAAWSEPFDVEAFHDARRKRAEYLANIHLEQRFHPLEVFEKLPPADQLIYARNSTINAPVGMTKKTC